MSMINTKDILETIKMIEEEHLDIRTITMGISLRDLAADDINVLADKVYDKVTRRAEKLVATGEQIERELGIPIINKRISVTPIAMVGATTNALSYVPIAQALDRAAAATGVNFIGGFSALVQKGFADLYRKNPMRAYVHWLKLRMNLSSTEIKSMLGMSSEANVDQTFSRAVKDMRNLKVQHEERD